MKMDLAILFEKPEKSIKALLTIEPLAPMSIVSTLPGSYYKSQDKPTKYNLCGIFENALGWHIGIDERKAILKKMRQVYKKDHKINDFETTSSIVGYTSLIGHLFEIELHLAPIITSRYDDLWKQQLKHDDSRHLKGTPNLSWYLIKQKRALPTDDKGKISDKEYGEFLKNNLSDFPMYYSSPTVREFITVEGLYQYKLLINASLLRALELAFQENNITYLGTNEGWIDLSIKEM